MSNEVYYILKVMPNDTLIWYELSADGQLLNKQNYMSFSELPTLNPKDKLIVFLPGQWFFMTRVKLPKSSKQNALKAVPFLIEEKLADDIDKLHIAVEKKTNDEYLVAAIEHSKMAEIHAELLENKITPLALLPDFMALNFDKDAWTLCLNEGVALMRTDAEEGFSIPEQQLSLALRLKAKQIQQGDRQKVNVSIQSVQSDVRTLLDKNSSYEFKVMDSAHPYDLELFQRKAPFNLLHGQYRLKAAKTGKPKYWRYAGIACCAWLLALFAGNVSLWAYFSKQKASINNQITSVYQSIFPNQVMSDPERMVEHAFSVRKSQDHQDQLVVLLTGVSQTLNQFGSLELQSMDYQDNQLSFKVAGAKLSDLSSFATALESHHLKIIQNQVDTGQKKVTALIKVKGA